MPRLTERREAGSASAEYAAVLVLAALILAALVVVVPNPLGENLQYEICKIFHPKNPEACESPADKEYKPETCTTGISADTYGADIDVAIFRVGKGVTFFKVKTSDGKVRVYGLENAKGGVQARAGAGLHWGKAFNIGGDASADATLNLTMGDGWTFDSEEEADKFIGDVKQQTSAHAVEHSAGPLGWLGGKIYEQFAVSDDLPEPNIKRYAISVDGNAAGTLGLGFGPKSKGGGSKRDGRGEKGIYPNVNAYASINANEKAILEQDSDTGTSKVTFRLDGTGRAGENHATPDGHEASGMSRGEMTLTYDKNGDLTGLDLAQTHAAGDGSTITTTHLPIDNEADRQTVYDHLLTHAGTDAMLLNFSDMAPTDPPGEDASPMDKLLYNEGQTSKVDYDYGSDADSYGGFLGLGVDLGAAWNMTSLNEDATGGKYLGAPDADGHRRWKNFKECESKS